MKIEFDKIAFILKSTTLYCTYKNSRCNNNNNRSKILLG